MKVGQKTIVRWIAKVAAVGSIPAARNQRAELRELDAGHVSGGIGGSTQSPGKTW
jgi:hypothetical protein